jgi:hypothetical protein
MGVTPHRFMLEAIVERTARAERDGDLQETANNRFHQMVASGETIPWTEMRKYLEDRLVGQVARRPTARKVTR